MIMRYVEKLLRKLRSIFKRKTADIQEEVCEMSNISVRRMTDNEHAAFASFIGEMAACANCKYFVASYPPQIISRDKSRSEIAYIGICSCMEESPYISGEYIQDRRIVQWDYWCDRFTHKKSGD